MPGKKNIGFGNDALNFPIRQDSQFDCVEDRGGASCARALPFPHPQSSQASTAATVAAFSSSQDTPSP